MWKGHQLINLINYFIRFHCLQNDKFFGSETSGEGDPLQTFSDEHSSPTWRWLDTRLHEHPWNGVQYVRTDDATEMVRLGGALLLLHKLRQLQSQRRHQTDTEQLHAVYICRCNVLSAKSSANDSAVGNCYAIKGSRKYIRSLEHLILFIPFISYKLLFLPLTDQYTLHRYDYISPLFFCQFCFCFHLSTGFISLTTSFAYYAVLTSYRVIPD